MVLIALQQSCIPIIVCFHGNVYFMFIMVCNVGKIQDKNEICTIKRHQLLFYILTSSYVFSREVMFGNI